MTSDKVLNALVYTALASGGLAVLVQGAGVVLCVLWMLGVVT